jgi:hypothetical protein
VTNQMPIRVTFILLGDGVRALRVNPYIDNEICPVALLRRPLPGDP